MLATMLKGERAVQTTLLIIETFVKISELSRTIAALPQTESGTELELNFAMLKLKYKVVREK